MQKASSGTAYLLWCLGLLGICGAQRFYTGNMASGLIYLFTLGIFGIGQLVDLALIPGMVEKKNAQIPGSSNTVSPGVNNSVTVNIGEIPQLKNLIEAQSSQLSLANSTKPMQKLLKAAKENGGQLSVAQVAFHTELEPQEVKELLLEATKFGYAEINNDPKTGAIRYHFDV